MDRVYVIDRIGVPEDAETPLETRLRALSEAAGTEIVALAERGSGVFAYVRADQADGVVEKLNYGSETAAATALLSAGVGGGRAA